MEVKPLPEWIVLSCKKIEPVGSRIVCNPPPTDTDQDWLCLLHKNINQSDFLGVLQGQGWQIGGSMPLGSDWTSVRLGEDNLILTKSIIYFDGFMKATAICKEKNLLDKKDRIAVFDKILGKQKKETKSLRWKSLYNASIFDEDPWIGGAHHHVWVEPVPVQPELQVFDDMVVHGQGVAQQAVPQVSSLLQGLLGNIGIQPPQADPD